MQLTCGITISRGDQVNRQTLYNLLGLANAGTVTQSDLHESVQTIVAQSEAPTAFPGKLWFDQTDQLMKVYTDMIDGTGCSLWLAIGPDRFDVALLANQPIPFGAAVQLAGQGRRAKLPPDPLTMASLGPAIGEWETAKVMGFNNDGMQSSHLTAASGAWFAAAVDGIVWAWYPVNHADLSNVASVGNAGLDGLISGVSGLTGPSGISEVRGGLVSRTQGGDIDARTGPILVPSTYALTAGEAFWARRVFTGPRIMQH